MLMITLVPDKRQDNLPKGANETVSDPGSQGYKTHATGDSKVPQKLQEVLPESIERAVPDSIHDTSKLPPK